jgi:excisionase family DNA binding protein
MADDGNSTRLRATFTVDELAARWGVHRRTVVREIERGRLVALRIANVLRIPIASVESYEARRTLRPRLSTGSNPVTPSHEQD